MPLELKTELMYQKRYVEDILKTIPKESVHYPVYEKWLQHVNRLIDICVKRNRF